MPLNPFSKKENQTKQHKKSTSSTSSSSSSKNNKYEIKCCEKKFAKIATGILSTGLVASQCEINRINNNVLLVEPKFEAVLTSVMQTPSTPVPTEPLESVAYDAMVNAVWSDLTTWKQTDPCLTNYLWVYEFSYSDYLNQRFGNFNVLNNDILEIKYGVTSIDQGATPITLNTLANYTSVQSPLYYNQIVLEANNIQNILQQIFCEVSVPPNIDSSNYKPVVTNASYRDKLDYGKLKNARVAVWREIADVGTPPVITIESKYYIAGFSSKACRKPCSPCKKPCSPCK